MEVIGNQLKEFKDLDKNFDELKEFKNLDKNLDKEVSSLFKCIIGLNKTESRVFSYILRNKDISTSEIANELKMDRSSIQRAIQALTELELITRKSLSMKKYSGVKNKTNIKRQGYLYVYNAKEIESIKTHFKVLLDEWYNSMVKYIENLENMCECCGLKFNPC